MKGRLSTTPGEPPAQGRTVTATLKLGSANGWTRALRKADWMQPSAGVPAAGPDTWTFWTRPFEPKTTVARDGAS